MKNITEYLKEKTEYVIQYLNSLEKGIQGIKLTDIDNRSFNINELTSHVGFALWSDWCIKGTAFMSFADLNSNKFKNLANRNAFKKAFEYQQNVFLNVVDGEDGESEDEISWMDNCLAEYVFTIEFLEKGIRDKNGTFHDYPCFLVNSEFAISEGPSTEHYILRDDLVLRVDNNLHLDKTLEESIKFINNFFESL